MRFPKNPKQGVVLCYKMSTVAGIYIHIPFCKQACYYCDFHFSTNQELKSEMITALCKELTLQRNYLGSETVGSIYFGGGTPSLLGPTELSDVIQSVKRNFSLAENLEVTLEANPDDLNIMKLQQLKSVGINRLSIGIQSFDDSILRFLNRAHNSQAAIGSVKEARLAGFKNISVDLIFGIPGQSNEVWEKDIDLAIMLGPEHISSYSLTIENNTVFGRWLVNGTLDKVPDDDAATQLEILIEKLNAAGYEQYEVSNFGKPGYYAVHNSSYWKQEKYLGVGPSAHSFNGTSRQFNVRNNSHYLKALRENKIPCELENLSHEDRINEYLLTTLRTSWGCDLTKLKTDYSIDLLEMYSEYISELLRKNLAVIDNNFLKLTRSGRLLADKISSDLFVLPV